MESRLQPGQLFIAMPTFFIIWRAFNVFLSSFLFGFPPGVCFFSLNLPHKKAFLKAQLKKYVISRIFGDLVFLEIRYKLFLSFCYERASIIS